MRPIEGDFDPTELLSQLRAGVSAQMAGAPWQPYCLIEPTLPGPWIGDTSSVSGRLNMVRLAYGDWTEEAAPHAGVLTTTRPRLDLARELFEAPRSDATRTRLEASWDQRQSRPGVVEIQGEHVVVELVSVGAYVAFTVAMGNVRLFVSGYGLKLDGCRLERLQGPPPAFWQPDQEGNQ